MTSPWPHLLAHHWPGARPRLLHRLSTSPEPYVTLDAGSYEAWLRTRSASFRAQVRKVRRRLDQRGVTTRRTQSAGELAGDLRAFLGLHKARWAREGGSGVVTPAVEAMLFEAGPALLREGRLDVWSMEAGGHVVCSQICLLSEGYATLWLQGYDQRWAHARLGLACMAGVIEDGFDRGIQRISLGEGGQEYKYRFADGEERLAWSVLPLPGPRLGLVLAGLQGRRLKRAAGPPARARAGGAGAAGGRSGQQPRERLERVLALGQRPGAGRHRLIAVAQDAHQLGGERRGVAAGAEVLAGADVEALRGQRGRHDGHAVGQGLDELQRRAAALGQRDGGRPPRPRRRRRGRPRSRRPRRARRAPPAGSRPRPASRSRASGSAAHTRGMTSSTSIRAPSALGS